MAHLIYLWIILYISWMKNRFLKNFIVDSNAARNRDNAIANGLDPNISYQPYARDLANILHRDRNASSNIPSTILPRDEEFIKSVAPNC